MVLEGVQVSFFYKWLTSFPTIATNRIKYLGVYLPKEMKDLYIENYMSFLLPLDLPCVSWASQECCLFSLRSSLWSSDLPLFYFCRLFPSLSVSHCHSGPFPAPHSNYLTVGREALVINNRTDNSPLKGRSDKMVCFYLTFPTDPLDTKQPWWLFSH